MNKYRRRPLICPLLFSFFFMCRNRLRHNGLQKNLPSYTVSAYCPPVVAAPAMHPGSRHGSRGSVWEVRTLSDWRVVNGHPVVISCSLCGASRTVPVGTLRRFLTILRRFRDRHANCKRRIAA